MYTADAWPIACKMNFGPVAEDGTPGTAAVNAPPAVATEARRPSRSRRRRTAPGGQRFHCTIVHPHQSNYATGKAH